MFYLRIRDTFLERDLKEEGGEEELPHLKETDVLVEGGGDLSLIKDPSRILLDTNEIIKRNFLSQRLKKPDDIDLSIQNSLEGLTDDNNNDEK